MYVEIIEFCGSPKFLNSIHLNLNLLCASVDARCYETELANLC
jgi:hypothetical protein